jgi:hypothetical protein
MFWWRRKRDGDTSLTPGEARDERLSRYLDGDLTAQELSAVEAELAADAVAREALEGLSEVRTALASLGEVRAPRSFALAAPPAPVARSAPRLEWVMRAATGTAALLFVVAVAGPAGTAMQTTDDAGPAFEAMAAPAAAQDATGAEPGVAMRSADAESDAKEDTPTTALQAPAPPDATPAPSMPDRESASPARPATDGKQLGVGGGIEPVDSFAAGRAGGPGGVAAGLGVLTLLLAALSTLQWWQGRGQGRT